MDRFERLKQNGIANGMCKQFQDEWNEPSVPELCRFFFRGMDFCIQHDWPSLEMIKEFFDADEVQQYGVYIKDGSSYGQTNVAVLGDADVHVFVPAFGVCDIYARHNSKVHLHLGVGSFCYVSILDDADVIVEEKNGGARLNASYYSGTIRQLYMFDKVHNKNKEK